jgi:hypothetical protein
VKDGRLALDGDDPIVNETMVTRGGEVMNEKVREALGEDHRSSTAGPAANGPERSAD